MATTQQFVISKSEAAVVAWCPRCADNVGMVTSEVAAVMTGVNSGKARRFSTGEPPMAG